LARARAPRYHRRAFEALRIIKIPMHIRAYLFLMAAAILVPVVVFAGIALSMLLSAERDAALRGLNETANGIALLVDRELYSAEAALRVLAMSPSLSQQNLPAFYEQARSAGRGATGWTVLVDASGRQLANTTVPFGTDLPPVPDPTRVQRAIATQRTQVTGLLSGPVTRQLVATVNVPVTLDGGRRSYLLVGAFSTDHFRDLIAQAKVPEGWVVGIIDRDGRFIARNLNDAELVGRHARPELVEAARLAQSGRIRHHTLEGVEVYDVFTHSALSGWTVAVAAPVSGIEQAARRASLVATLGLLAAMVAAGVLAILCGRLHVSSIRRAVKAATDLGNGVPPAPVQSRVAEMNELHSALHRAGEQMLQAQAYRKHAEAEREAVLEAEQRERRMAEQQNEAKDQFLAMLGHELRNPLAPISTAAQLLRLQSNDPDRVRYASEVISRQVDHMNSLLGDMLDVSRVTRGLVSLSLEHLDLRDVIDRAREQTQGLIDLKHHQLALHLPDASLVVNGDRTRLIQIFANLLNNAAKYTLPHGRIEITAVSEGPVARVTVQDNGEGLSAELLPRIFDLFSQGERKPDRSQGGLGLGLALVKSLVQLHGGSVAASSAGPGLGSVFTVTLPLVSNAGQPVEAGPNKGAVAGARRIMVVDDNIDGAISLSLFLKEAGGHYVSTYYDAGAALEWAVFEHPDVFILDIGLPDITGYELARRLRAMPQFAHAVFIALTGYGQPQDRDRAFHAGFDFHVSKPADPQHILVLLAGLPGTPAGNGGQAAGTAAASAAAPAAAGGPGEAALPTPVSAAPAPPGTAAGEPGEAGVAQQAGQHQAAPPTHPIDI
jgi:signal transduction histidine kinase/ActR/RegA family two-component response regulator